MLSRGHQGAGERLAAAAAVAVKELADTQESLGTVLSPVLDEGAARPGGFHPVLVGEVDLRAGLRSFTPALEERARRRAADPASAPEWALVLVRLHSAPLGLVCLDLRVEHPEREWPATVLATLGGELARHVALDDDEPAPVAAPRLWEGVALGGRRCLERRRRALAAARPVSVVIATRERIEALDRCLQSVLKLEYPDFEVIVVDNAPLSDATEKFVASKYGERVRYVREDRKGLAAAHNGALGVARGEILAFTDDDVLVDPHWLAELAVPFSESPGVACVTGLIVPAELETESQLMLETHGRFSKGFATRSFDLGANRPADALFPYAAGILGSGANMAFDAAYLRKIGGFNPALGTGTLAMGGDDLAAFFRVIRDGHALVYRPDALVWHHHRRDRASVRRQAYGYGVGFGAYLASVCAAHPGAALHLATHFPAAAAYSFSRTSAANIDAGPLARAVAAPAWPRELVRAQRLGMLAGPYAYFRSARATRRRARAVDGASPGAGSLAPAGGAAVLERHVAR